MPADRAAPPADWLRPDWPAGAVGALMSTRHGGVSRAPFDGLNLGRNVGDEPAAVRQNRLRFEQALGARPVYLNQRHGTRVVRLHAADLGGAVEETEEADDGRAVHAADASVTDEPGIACAVMAADCLPVLFAAPGGRAVGAAHAGWRGLAGGVLEATVRAVCALGRCEPPELRAWLGACIGPTAFEVGHEVLAAFAAHATGSAARFAAQREGKWLADLPGLARDRLQAAGLVDISGGRWCTVSEASRFFSYRRDRVTGRMAAAVWVEPGGSP